MSSLNNIVDNRFQKDFSNNLNYNNGDRLSIIKQDNYFIEKNAIQKESIFPIGNFQDFNNIHIIENVDLEKVKYILSMKFDEMKDIFDKCKSDDEIKINFNKVKKYCSNLIKENGKVTHIYKYASNNNNGRLFSTTSIQGISYKIRGFLFKYTTDFDFSNCHPKILLYICKKYDIQHSNLEYYCSNRDKILENGNKDKNKLLILKFMNDNKICRDLNNPFLIELDKEFKFIQKELLKIEDFNFLIETIPEYKFYNFNGSFINRILCFYENMLLQDMIYILKNEGKDLVALMFDGCMIMGNYYNSDGDILIKKIEDFINNKYNNLNIQIKMKEHDNSIKIPDRWTPPPENYLTIENMIKSPCESDFADIYFDYNKNNMVSQGKDKERKFYIYYNNEWRSDNDCYILLNCIIEWLKQYIKNCFLFMGVKKAECTDDTEKMKKLSIIDKDLMIVNNGIKKVNFCKNVLTFIKSKLSTKFDIIHFDIGYKDLNNIHFKNGVYDLKNKKFRNRHYYDYVTKWLDYNYIEYDYIDEKIHTNVLDFFKKIQPDEEQRKFTLSYLSYCLSGSIDKQKFKMNVGYTAQNGKSTEMAIHETCFGLYTKKLNSETFLLNNTKRHKSIIELLHNPIRLAYIEELPTKNLDVDFLKDFVDGKKISCEVMFGTEDCKKIQSKLMTCSNHDFHGKTDEGLKRRGLIQHYTSKFLNDDGINEFDNNKNIYRRIDGFEKMFDCLYYKNAYFHLLLKYFDNLIIPKENEDNFIEVCDDNDFFKNKLFDMYEMTNDVNDIVYWKDICVLFGANDGKENRKLIDSDMKRLQIIYDKDKRANKVKKGCYIKLKLIT